VLQVTTGLGFGGAEIVVRDLARALDRDRFEVSVCCLKELGPVGEAMAREGLDVVALQNGASAKVDYFTFLKLRRLIRARHIDVVHSHTAYAMVDACLCKFLVPGLRVVHTFHFGNYPITNRTVLRTERLCSGVADRLIAVSNVQREQVRSVYHLPPDRISTVWNGVNLARPCPDRGFRARIGAGDRLLVGTIATLIEQKGLHDLLRVAARCRDAGDNVHFVVVGDGRLRSDLESARNALGLDDRVTFTGWVENASGVALPVFDVYLQPSLWEAMSIAILEAMAAGKPVIATRVGETPHMIRDRVSGLLTDVGDVDAMAAAIRQLASQPAWRHRLGEAAARTVKERFSLQHMVAAYESLYLEMVGRDDAA
jgi:glycosyltransferase involved in cell wall biosynthesis